MSDEKLYTKKEIREIIDNMVDAISTSEIFMHRLLMADMYEESEMLKRQTECCFRVLGAVANLDELLKYEEEYKVEAFDMTSFITDIVDSCRVKTRNHLAKITLNTDGLIWVKCGKDRLGACLMNIIVNALQEIDPEEGRIRIDVKKIGDYGVLTVADNGYGLAGVDLSEYSKDGATGGFAVIRRFCESVGTTPLFETSENGGFTVTVKIPICHEPADLHASITKPRPGLFSAVNIYLSKIKRFDVTNLYKNY